MISLYRTFVYFLCDVCFLGSVSVLPVSVYVARYDFLTKLRTPQTSYFLRDILRFFVKFCNRSVTRLVDVTVTTQALVIFLSFWFFVDKKKQFLIGNFNFYGFLKQVLSLSLEIFINSSKPPVSALTFLISFPNYNFTSYTLAWK